MCEWHGGSYAGNLPVRLARPRANGLRVAYVDLCIQPIVQALNDAGLQTLASCCGHGRRPGSIVLEDGRELLIAPDGATARRMDRGFPPLADEGRR